MRSLPPILAAETAKTITKPGYLVQIDLPLGVVRLASRQLVTYAGFDWQPEGVAYSEAKRDGSGVVEARLTVRNTDTLFGKRCLNEDARGARVQVWVHYGENPLPGAGEVFYEFDGAVTQYEVTPQAVTLTLSSETLYSSFTPRRTVARWHGFNVVSPPDKVLAWGELSFRLSKAD